MTCISNKIYYATYWCLILVVFIHLSSANYLNYCCSFYGSNLWLLTSKRCYDVCVAWRRALRKLWNVPYRTHNKILAILSNNLPLEMSLDKCFIKFSNNVLNHSTGTNKSVASLSLYNPWSTFNRNNNYVCQMYGSSINESSVFKVCMIACLM